MPSLRKTHVCTTSPCTLCTRSRLALMKTAEGLCSESTCGRYLDPNSSAFCTEHLGLRKHADIPKFRGSQSEQQSSRSYSSSASGSFRTGTTTLMRSPCSSMYSLTQGSNRGTHNYTPPQNLHTNYPYQTSATSVTDPGSWDNTLNGQFRAPSSQAYSSYGGPPSLLGMDQNHPPSEPTLQGFYDNDDGYPLSDGYGYNQSYTGPSQYSRPLPTATPSGECGKYEYQPWTWNNYHQNHPIRDPDSYY